MQHIYIHIPFCVKKCSYCDFYSITDLSLIDDYVGELCREISNFSACHHCENRDPSHLDNLDSRFYGNDINSIYFGGGTPSILSSNQLKKIFETLNRTFSISTDSEISIEVNPETVDREKLTYIKDIGFNRISVGVQSLVDEDLVYLGRIHSSKRAIQAVEIATEIFDNVNVDMIFGLQTDRIEKLKFNINRILILKPQHLSCYELTYEKETPLYNDMSERDEDELAQQYLSIKQLLEANSYKQYEVSNYALKGFECRHNLAYWSDKSYLGFGLSAHSYVKKSLTGDCFAPLAMTCANAIAGSRTTKQFPENGLRWANTSNMSDYLNGRRIKFVENAKNIDVIMMGLRKNTGIESSSVPAEYNEKIEELINENLLERKDSNIRFTEKGMLLANQVFLDIL